MDEVMLNNDLKIFMDAIQGLIEIEDDALSDEVMTATMEQIEAMLSPLAMEQSINQIIQKH